MRGNFVTFEGIDGSGKTTIAQRVYETLKNGGEDVVFTCEPTKTWLGDMVKKSYNEDISPFTEMLLFMADRATHTKRIREWLNHGKIVICDRYNDSTIAYQGAALEKELGRMELDSVEWIKKASEPIVIKPDITILLLIDPEDSLERVRERSKPSKFEDIGFLKKVEKNYHRLAREKRFVKIDATKSIDEVVSEAMRYIDKLLTR